MTKMMVAMVVVLAVAVAVAVAVPVAVAVAVAVVVVMVAVVMMLMLLMMITVVLNNITVVLLFVAAFLESSQRPRHEAWHPQTGGSGLRRGQLSEPSGGGQDLHCFVSV